MVGGVLIGMRCMDERKQRTLSILPHWFETRILPALAVAESCTRTLFRTWIPVGLSPHLLVTSSPSLPGCPSHGQCYDCYPSTRV